MSRATLLTTSPLLYPPEALAKFRRVEQKVRLSRYGYDCYAFAMLAAGHVDCVIEAGVKAYDIAPLIPIIEGAGRHGDDLDRRRCCRGRRCHRLGRQAPARSRVGVACGLNPRGAAASAKGRAGAAARRRGAQRLCHFIFRARHEGVKRCPELAAENVALHQDVMPRLGQGDEMAGLQAAGERFDRRRCDDPVGAGGDDQRGVSVRRA